MTKESDLLASSRKSDSLVNASRKAVLEMPEGEPGECNECGEFNQRLVYGSIMGFKVKIKIVPWWDGCVLLPEDL